MAFEIIGHFLLMIVGSIVIGVLAGFIMTFCLKKMRFLHHDDGISETCFLFLSGFFIYLGAEQIDMSGAITVLLLGITLNHYNQYNLSE